MLVIITGIMHAGKSERLVEIAGKHKNAVFFKPAQVVKGGFGDIEVYGRGRITTALSAEYLDPVLHDEAFIDEAQFLNDAEIATVLYAAKRLGQTVYAAMIYSDFRGDVFPTYSKLLPYADKIIALEHRCERCGKKEATRNVLFLNGRPTVSGDVFHMEADEEPCYEALCTECTQAAFKEAERD